MSKQNNIVVLIAVLLPYWSVFGADTPLSFHSDGYKVFISANNGSITKICNTKTGKEYSVAADDCLIETDLGTIKLSQMSSSLVSQKDNSCVFISRRKNIEITRTYNFPADRLYFDRIISIKNLSAGSPAVIRKINDCSLRFLSPFKSIHFHDDGMDHCDAGSEKYSDTSRPLNYHNSMNVFLRDDNGGLFVGIKYPNWEAERSEDWISVSYETNYRIAPGQTLELPAMFCGAYKNIGFTCRKELHWKPRIVSMDQEELDLGEVRAMRQVVRDYLPEEPLSKEYLLFLNIWWANLVTNSALNDRIGEVEAVKYCEMIDRVKKTKCIDWMSTGPVWVGWAGFTRPCPEIDAIGEDANFPLNPHIQKVLDCSKSLGVGLSGFCEPVAGERHYRKDRPDWRLQPTEDDKKLLNQKCWANDEYADWFYRLTCSAIDRCGLKAWAWDHNWVRKPMVCYGKTHGHEPGNCEFQQFRNVTNYIQKLRKRYPDMMMDISWGLKETGAWGHKGISVHENLYENASPAPPDMTDADDERFQHWYNHTYRFFPTYMNRCQINFERKEKNGHLYSILSALSAGSQGQLNDWKPFDTQEDADKIFALLRYWKKWANENLLYLKDCIDLFGQPCRKGGIDGTAHIIGDRGFIFVFNPWPEKMAGSVPLGGIIGLEKGERFAVSVISKHPVQNSGVYAMGEDFIFTIPGKSALLFELVPTTEPVKHTEIQLNVIKVQPAFQK